jgi:FMN phosphatase YigB (HAD superfamily)
MTINMEQIEIISFDVGGTLLYPWPSVGSIYADCIGEYGLELPAEKWQSEFKQAWITHSQLSDHKTSSEKDWWYTLVKAVVSELGELSDLDLMFDDLWHRFASPNYWRLF